MRHNPAAGAVIIMLRTLKMHGMAQAVSELTEQGSPAFEAALPILSQLLKAETADREVRSTAYQLKAARFPNYRDLAGFDFASSEVSEALARQLHRCEFLEDAHNVVLVGGPGTGKTHLATAIGVQAIERHRKTSRTVPAMPEPDLKPADFEHLRACIPLLILLSSSSTFCSSRGRRTSWAARKRSFAAWSTSFAFRRLAISSSTDLA